jgi:gas vesicle protein
MRLFLLGVLIGIVIGAAGAMIYAELSSAPEEELLEVAAAQQR